MKVRLRYPLRVALLYALFGGLWILVSDRLAVWLFPNPQLLLQISTYKGWFFIVVTTLLLYLELRKEYSRVEQMTVTLRESEERYRLITENSADVIWTLDLASQKFTYVSPSVFNLRGLTPEEVMLELMQASMTPASFQEVSERLPARIANFMAGDLSARTQTNLVNQTRKDGSIVPTEVVTNLITDAKGRVVEILGITRDITERKRAEEALRASEARYRSYIEVTGQIGWVTNVDGEVAEDVPALRKFSGQSYEEAKGTGWTKALHPDDLERTLQVWNQAVTTKSIYEVEYRMRRYDGVYRHLLARGFPVCKEDGSIREWVGTCIDITERKQAEEELKESEERWRRAIVNSPIPIMIHDEDDRVLQLSAGWMKFSGYDIDDIPTLADWTERAYGERSGFKKDYIDQLFFINQTVQNGEWIVTAKDGSKRIWDFQTTPLGKGSQGRRVLHSMAIDTTERKLAEEKLRETNEYLENLFNYANAPIIVWDPQFRIARFNHAFETLTGRSSAEVLGKPIEILFPPALVQASKELIQKTLTGERWEVVEISIQHVDGSIRTVLWNSATLFSADGTTPIATIAQGQDVTERKQAEVALATSQKLFQDVIDNSMSLIYSLDLDGRFLLINRSLETVFGVPRATLIGKTREAILPLNIAETHRTNDLHVIAQRVPATYEEENDEPDGKHTYLSVKFPLFDFYGNVHGIGGISTDITKRKQAEQVLQEYNTRLATEVEQRTRELGDAQEQLVRQERLAMLGQLAGSIGHELRNPLGVISNAVYFLKISQPTASDKIKEYLDIIEKETRTSDKIVTDLLDFTRIKSLDRQPASVSELIHQALERHPAPESVETELEIPSDLPQIYADPMHVIQVLVNLISNACQAMDSGVTNDGKLKVSAAAQGAMIKIDVQDTGVGIPPENMKKIFEPLFTTKTKGIGLGLPVSRKLTEANGGRIEVESEAGKGSTFTVYLPAYMESV